MIIYIIDLISIISNSMIFPKFISRQGLASVSKGKNLTLKFNWIELDAV